MNARAFAPISAADLMDGETPARRELLSPLLASSSSVLVYGPRGVGKTLFALGIAWAAASGGSFLGWQAPRAHRVTYIDGELGGDDMRGRLALFGAVPPSLQFFLADRGGPPLDLTRLDNQHRLMEQWGDPELVVFDSPSSLAALCSSDSTRWEGLQRFLQRQKKFGRAMLVVHHANRHGRPRGGQHIADPFDLVIGLQRPRGWRPADGACFEIRFESGRQLSGGVLESRVAKLATDAGGRGAWQWGTPDAPPLARAVALLKSGSTVKEVKRALGVSPSTAYRLRTRAIARGLLPDLTLTESG